MPAASAIRRAALYYHFSFIDRYWRAWYAAAIPLFRRAHPGFSFEISDESGQKLSQLLAQPAGDTVLAIMPTDLVPGFARRGLLLDLDAALSVKQTRAFLPRALDGCRYDDRLHALPRFADMNLLLYHRDLLAKYKFHAPRTWNELVRQCQVVGAGEKIDGLLTCGLADQPGLLYLFFEYLLAAGCLPKREGLYLDRTRTEQALVFFRDLVQQHKIMRADHLLLPLDRMVDLFIKKQALFVYFTSDLLLHHELRTQFKRLDIGTCLVPPANSGPAMPLLSGNALVVPANTRYPDLGLDLLQRCADLRLGRKLAKQAGFPQSLNVYQGQRAGKIDYAQRMQDGHYFGELRPYFWDIAHQLGTELRAVLVDGKNIRTALDRIYEAFWFHNRQGRYAQTVEQTLSFLDAHYPEPLSLRQIAEIAHVSPDYLSRQFKTVVGQSCMEYLVRVRVERSRQLLDNTNLSVQEIAAQVGYPDPYHFSRVFKQKTGLAPQMYRKRG
jgi:AraC-like DNA-binding protein